MKHILLVEDNDSLGSTLQERLQKEGYQVSWVPTLAEAREAFDRGKCDIILLDIGLPDGSGFSFAEQVKARTKVPIVFMTAMSSAENRLQGYELGAEDFIPKPFHLRELLLRVEQVLDSHAVRHTVQVGSIEIDLDAMSIKVGDDQRFIPLRDFKVLKLLIDQAPRIISRDEVLDQVWGKDKFPSPRTVDNTIVRLRQSLGDTHGNLIRSVRGVGYQWSGEQDVQ